MRRQMIMQKSEEAKDKIRVMAKCGSGPYRSFYITITGLKLNGGSVGLFGRQSKNGSDRNFEATEVVFRTESDLELLIAFSVNLAFARFRPVSARVSCEDMESPEFIEQALAGSLGQKIRRRIFSHPSIRIDDGLFKRAL